MWIRLYDDTDYEFGDIAKYRNGELVLDTMRISAPKEMKGKSVYIDDLEFRKNIFWNRASDYQVLTEKRVDDGKTEIGNWSGHIFILKEFRILL